MSQINYAGVLKGGVVTALIMNVSEFVLNVPIAGAQMDRELAARNLPPVGAGAIVVFTTLTLLLGFVTVWLYAAIRPRLGPGPRTAMIAGLAVWATTYLYSAIAFGVLGINSMGLVVLTIVWTLIEMTIASAAGAYFYNEE
jgi:hypothetical protein